VGRKSVVAVIFDVDGVLVASPHERAWRDALADLMATDWHASAPATRYTTAGLTTAVYQEHVAGKARLDGATALLEYFGVPQAAPRAVSLAERKQAMIDALIERGEFEAFPDAVRLVLALRARRVALAVASSSKNANRFMAGVRLNSGETLRDVFDANVCGRALAHGKPAPDIFLLAAKELGVSPAHCVVIEDATAGIQAARAGGMQAVGVARVNDAALLAAAGAGLVVSSLDQVVVDALAVGLLECQQDGSKVRFAGTTGR
jgi:beta-phosphoglucomutase